MHVKKVEKTKKSSLSSYSTRNCVNSRLLSKVLISKRLNLFLGPTGFSDTQSPNKCSGGKVQIHSRHQLTHSAPFLTRG